MITALVVTQQQSTDVTDPRWVASTTSIVVPRCNGLMVAEWCQDLSDHRAQRCVQCGEVIVRILQNRLQYGMTSVQIRMRATPHENV